MYVSVCYESSRIFVSSCIFFFKQQTAYEMRISDWSSDVCSSDLGAGGTRNQCYPVGSGKRNQHLQICPLPWYSHREGKFLVYRCVRGIRAEQCLVQIGRASCRERVCQYV